MSESDYEAIVSKHYSQKQVQEEIARFSQDRWVALHCEILNPQGYPVWLRYQKSAEAGKVPLTIKNTEDVPTLLKRFKRLRPRTFYASICVYRELTRQDHVKDFGNIVSCSPIWDIDNAPQNWKTTIEVAKEISKLLQEEGVSRSAFLKWSGQGAHVHIHHKAFSQTLLRKIAPLDVAYSVVEYVNRTLKPRFTEIADKHGSQELIVENETDIQRVFTCPLSLHRSLDSVAVCIAPASVEEFNPDWTKLNSFRHWSGWGQFEVGEGDALAAKAYRLLGGYATKTVPKLKRREASDSITKWLGNN